MEMDQMKMEWDKHVNSMHKMKKMMDEMESMEGMDQMKMEMDNAMESMHKMDEMMKKSM